MYGLADCIQLFVWFGRLHSVICVGGQIFAFSYVCGLAGCIQLFVWFGRLHSVMCVGWQIEFSYLCDLAD